MAMKPWSQTFTGRKLWYDKNLETKSEIDLYDIAHHLAMTNRYGGATNFPYSVAQHSVLMAKWVIVTMGDFEVALDCLMHDAPEYAVTDLRKMLKDQCPEFEAIENRFDKLIRASFKKYGLVQKELPITKQIDSRIVNDERRQVMLMTDDEWFSDSLLPLGVSIEEWPWHKARDEFLQTFIDISSVLIARMDATNAAA